MAWGEYLHEQRGATCGCLDRRPAPGHGPGGIGLSGIVFQPEGEMTMFILVLSAISGLLLVAFLVAALLKPEWFQ